ncbi:MAG: restriction endonuclease, partial [candidate division WS1 bacterium]|nr:restriction endonuclease [candidate division WS1 bacterium]
RRTGPKTLVNLVPDFVGIADKPKDITELLADIALAERWFADKDIARERTEQWNSKVLALLRAEREALVNAGRICHYDFNTSSPHMIQGAAFVEPADPPETRSAKSRRAQFDEYVAALSGLSPRHFEALCAGMLRLLDVDDAKTTSYVADEGIDFFGRWHLEKHVFPQDPLPTVQKQLNVWMIGQAKHYQRGQAATPDLRDLVGAVDLARGKAFSRDDIYQDLSVRPCDPVFYLFFTTGRISTNGWALSERSGVVVMDGDMIAAFLSDRGVGMDTNNHFSEVDFREWLAQF